MALNNIILNPQNLFSETALNKVNTLESEVFNTDMFRKYVEIAVSQLQLYLDDTSIRGINLLNPSILENAARDLMTKEDNNIATFDKDRLKSIIDLYIKTGIQVHSPGFMGRQFSGVVPLTGVFDMVNSIVNQPSSFYEAAQLPSVAERIMAEELNRFIGFNKDTFTMVTTSGGSLANLTALLAARNDKLPGVWDNGVVASHQKGIPAIAISENAHYSITRAAGIIGIGENQIVKLPVNSAKQIHISKVQKKLDAAKSKGLNVFCIVASAGTTSIGAFDNLDELTKIAHDNNIWLHVDGAHGASLLVSDILRHKLKGIEKVDSLTWDAHKMMFVPSPCSLLFYREKEKSYGAFHQEASYVFEKHADVYTEYDSAEKNFECTKRPMIMNLWVLWAIYGRALFSEKIEYLCNICMDAYTLLEEEPDFDTIHIPESNILCFRYNPNFDLDELPIDFQVEIRNQIRGNGHFFISKVDIDKVAALRVVFMNHQTEIKHFKLLLNEIRYTGQSIINENNRQLVINKTY